MNRNILIALALSVFGSICAADIPVFKDRVAQESYAIGAQTARTLRKDKIDIDVEMLVKGLRDGLSDGSSILLMSEKDIKSVMSRVQQDVRKNMIMNRREQAERARVEGAQYLENLSKQPNVFMTPGGVRYQIEKAGFGPKPILSDAIRARYRGTLLNGSEIDASPVDEPSGKIVIAQTIPGLKEVLQLMPVGSHWKIAIPAVLGFGERGRDSDLGPNEVLLFDLELMSIEPK